MERKFHGTFAPGSESSIEYSLPGAKVPGSESSIIPRMYAWNVTAVVQIWHFCMCDVYRTTSMYGSELYSEPFKYGYSVWHADEMLMTVNS